MCEQEATNIARPNLSILATPVQKVITISELNERMLSETIELEEVIAEFYRTNNR